MTPTAKSALIGESILQASSPCLAVAVFKDEPLSGLLAELDEARGGRIAKLLESGAINTSLGQFTPLFNPAGIAAERLVLIGAGDKKRFDEGKFIDLNVRLARYLREQKLSGAINALAQMDWAARDLSWRTRQAVIASHWGAYRYTATKSKPGAAEPLMLQFPGDGQLQAEVDLGQAIAAGVHRARELGNLPPNICNPAYLAQTARELTDSYDNTSLTLLDKKQMSDLGMGALLAVAQGSANDPYLIALTYSGGSEGDAPYAFVGKGITFDTGGISLKPGAGMHEMKYDMGGAAGVLGTFEAICQAKLPINVICVVPAVENMPGSNAYRPGDIVTSMSGQTIEVLNTDAEGRMILCDALTWVQQFDPQVIIDTATLTGACVIALGKHASGLMTHQDDLANELVAAGIESHDRAWRLPLWDEYQKQLDTPHADMANVGGKEAGTITAGCFLGRFTKDQRWAHVDIAGTAWPGGTKQGATGRPVGMFMQYLLDRVAEL